MTTMTEPELPVGDQDALLIKLRESIETLIALKEPTLFVTDAELIRRLGVPEKKARQALRMLDQERRSGFPQKSAFWSGRRYWPAVREFLDRTNGLSTDKPPALNRR
jgi:hypothetical protein